MRRMSAERWPQKYGDTLFHIGEKRGDRLETGIEMSRGLCKEEIFKNLIGSRRNIGVLDARHDHEL